MSLTLIRHDEEEKRRNSVHNPTGRIGHSLHFYYDISQTKDVCEQSSMHEKEENELNDNNVNDENNNMNGYNDFINGKYKIVLYGGGLLDYDFTKNYASEFLMNVHGDMTKCDNNENDKDRKSNIYNSTSIENYLIKTYNDTYICEEENEKFINWKKIKTYNVPSPRAFQASCVVNLGRNGVFLFVHGGKKKNNILADNKLHALNLTVVSSYGNNEKVTNDDNNNNSNTNQSDSNNNNNNNNKNLCDSNNEGNYHCDQECNPYNEQSSKIAENNINQLNNSNLLNEHKISSMNNICLSNNIEKKNKNQGNCSSSSCVDSNNHVSSSTPSLTSSSNSSDSSKLSRPPFYFKNEKDMINDTNGVYINSRKPINDMLKTDTSSCSNYSSDYSYTSESEKIKRKWVEIKIKGKKPSKRYGHSLDFLYPHLVLFGGNEEICDEDNSFCKNDLWILNIKKCKKGKETKNGHTYCYSYFLWEEVNYQYVNPFGRSFHSTAIWYDTKKKKNNLILYGGKMKNQNLCSRLFLLQYNGYIWSWSILPVYVNTLNEHRAYHSMICANNYIFIIGGEEYNYKYIEKMPSALYSFESKKFQYINDFTAKACLKCFAKQDIIYSWGGFTDIPFDHNFFPNNFVLLHMNVHIASTQIKDGLSDDNDGNVSLIMNIEENPDDNIYKRMSKRVMKIENKKNQLEKDLSYQIKLNENMNSQLKEQITQYQKIMYLLNVKNKQNAYLLDLLKKKSGYMVDNMKGELENNNNLVSGDIQNNNLVNNNFAFNNINNNYNVYENSNVIPENTLNVMGANNMHNEINSNNNNNNNDNNNNNNNDNNNNNNNIEQYRQSTTIINTPNQNMFDNNNNFNNSVDNINSYNEIIFHQNVQNYITLNGTTKDNIQNGLQNNMQQCSQSIDQLNVFNNEQIKNDLLNIENNISNTSGNTNNYYLNGNVNVNNNNFDFNLNVNDYSNFVTDKLPPYSNSSDLFINNNMNFLNDASTSHVNFPLANSQVVQVNNNYIGNMEASVKHNISVENTLNEIKAPEVELPSNQRARRKTAEKCLKLIEQDRLSRMQSESNAQ
ncbi:hypothetical protein PFHG_02881 [Plasmodium falciparum HB3]|uniref:Kelch domain-containing protein n=1 Tax=Plasmodium falciparum (isolate HB3) TaxID=137071 RepID=A0A0L7KCN7_PLAFX|nr:hypothetical protein PFHG_02881 [Plasmodium falciparum HB3]